MSTTTSLTCPVCTADLQFNRDPRPRLSCPAGHVFDAAKQGYFNFLTGKGTNFLEDTSEMVQARQEFLQAGHYAPLAELLVDTVGRHHHAEHLDILDAGAGTGYYLGQILRRFESSDALALDISRYAMRKAAKLPHTFAVVWDAWRRLPTADASRDVVLNCFAPHNPEEFARVLRPDGLALIVTGADDHLGEVRDLLGMLSIAEGKQQTLERKFDAAGMAHQGSQNLTFPMSLASDDLYNLAYMGPAGHHVNPDELRERTTHMSTTKVTASFDVHLFIPRT